jgi:hypothetical protein
MNQYSQKTALGFRHKWISQELAEDGRTGISHYSPEQISTYMYIPGKFAIQSSINQ